LAIATNAYKSSARKSLSYLKILDLFDCVVCADDVAEAKPNPQMLEKILY